MTHSIFSGALNIILTAVFKVMFIPVKKKKKRWFKCVRERSVASEKKMMPTTLFISYTEQRITPCRKRHAAAVDRCVVNSLPCYRWRGAVGPKTVDDDVNEAELSVRGKTVEEPVVRMELGKCTSLCPLCYHTHCRACSWTAVYS